MTMVLEKNAETQGFKPNPFLSGLHVPLAEESTIDALQVIGTIPQGLDGSYMRIGPNPMEPNHDNYHWFTGDGMIHGLNIERGQALWYRNRWIRSESISRRLGEDRVKGPRHPMTDTVNTNVIGFAGRTLAVVEAGSNPVELGDRLETLRFTDFEGTLNGSFTAHPHVDPLTGELHGICYDIARPDSVRYVVVATTGKVKREVEIPVEHGPMMHDSSITQRYAVILDLPVTFSRETAMEGHPFPYRWNDAHQARVGLLPRGGRAEEIVWCAVDPCFVFHVINSFDEPDGTVVLDVVVHDKMFSRSRAGPDAQKGGLERWIVDPVAKKVRRKLIDPTPQEFPRQDERRFSLPYRYGYTMALTGPFLGAALLKHDMKTGERLIHDFGPGRHPGEFVFVPAHAEAEEDEGWLIGLVIDAAADTTELVILDARNFGGEPQAIVRIPHRIPPGFHGNWIQRQH